MSLDSLPDLNTLHVQARLYHQRHPPAECDSISECYIADRLRIGAWEYLSDSIIFILEQFIGLNKQ